MKETGNLFMGMDASMEAGCLKMDAGRKINTSFQLPASSIHTSINTLKPASSFYKKLCYYK